MGSFTRAMHYYKHGGTYEACLNHTKNFPFDYMYYCAAVQVYSHWVHISCRGSRGWEQKTLCRVGNSCVSPSTQLICHLFVLEYYGGVWLPKPFSDVMAGNLKDVSSTVNNAGMGHF